MFIIPNQLRFSRKDFFFTSVLPPLLVFLTLMILIGMSWRTSKQAIDDQITADITEKSQYIESSIYQRFSVYEGALRAGTGLFNGSDSVNKSEWQSFVDSLKLTDRYPGIKGIGFAKAIKSTDKQAFTEAFRSKIEDFDIFPQSNRELSATVLFIVATSRQNTDDLISFSPGYDMYTDPGRQAALDTAITTGDATLTNQINLSKNLGEDLPGFLLYVPLYSKNKPLETTEQRQQAIEGFIFAPFISQDLFKRIFPEPEDNFAFTIYNDETKQKVFESVEENRRETYQFIKRDVLALYGQNWSIEYRAHKNIVSYTLRSRPVTVAAGGTILAGLLAGVIFLLLQRRARSISYMEEKKLEEAKDELLSLASHQLRTPATAVKQYIAMVKDGFAGKVTSDQQQLLEMAYENNERQLTIVDDLLYVARVDAGKANLRLEKFNIAALTKSVISDQAQILRERKQKVDKSGIEKPVYIHADPHYVRMILENLLNNASKYSYEKTTIRVSLRVLEDDVQISFKDKGVGIDKRDFNDVFQKFTRIPNELSRQTAGSGIGLYLSYQLALLHGGKITFTSTKGKGSIFTVHLPRTSLEKNL